MTTGELSQKTGVPVHTLRRLAAKSLIPAKRYPGGHAQWRFAAGELAEIVAKLKEFGFIETAKK
jgi:DNA-binding transcriptional MerR regulator